MERLTIKTKKGAVLKMADNYESESEVKQDLMKRYLVAVNRLAAYEDTGLEPEEVLTAKENAEVACALNLLKEYQSVGSVEHFRELISAEHDGRLAVLPCKVGDIVYEANKRGFISIYKVISIHISTCSVLIGWELIDGIYSNVNGFEASALGKTVFMTREEAEAELKKEAKSL